jgi:hypothetical protein
MKRIAAFIALLLAVAAQAGQTFTDVSATTVAVRSNLTVGGSPVITNIAYNGTNYGGGNVALPLVPGPQGDQGPAGATGTNYVFTTNIYQFISVTTNININSGTQVVYSTTINTNIYITITTNMNYYAASNGVDQIVETTSNALHSGTLYLKTNYSGGAGATAHSDLTGLNADTNYLHVTTQEWARIPSAPPTNSSYAWVSVNGTMMWSSFTPALPYTMTNKVTYSYIGPSNQLFVVPAGKSNIIAKLWGAGGSGAYNIQSGGNGGFTYAFIPVSGIATVTVQVGQGGQNGSGPGYSLRAWPNGGRGGHRYSNTGNAGGGGGYSALFNGTNLLCCAGGGGGTVGGAGTGGSGGGENGSAGAGSTPGLGGTQTAGGLSGGTYLSGGDVDTNGFTATSGCGGGGGGYYGGGISVATNQINCGGGGSGYVPASWGYTLRIYNNTDPDWQGSWSLGGYSGSSGGHGGIVILY